MTDIIIKRYRPEEFPRHLDFLERMTVTRGTVEDWHALKSFPLQDRWEAVRPYLLSL